VITKNDLPPHPSIHHILSQLPTNTYPVSVISQENMEKLKGEILDCMRVIEEKVKSKID